MTGDEADWVRAHAWTQSMRKTFRETPGHYQVCACQYGLTHHCATGSCGQCHRAQPSPPSWETLICGRTGVHPVQHAQPYKHHTQTITGPRHLRHPMVWLTGRTCRWRCPHDCHRGATTGPSRPAVYEQDVLPLFELAGSSR